jgi:ATP-binding protein involved in chromosome partitioning
MVGDVDVDRRGRVRISVTLTTPTCPLREEIRAAVDAAVRGVPGVTDAEVGFGALDASGRTALAARLRAEDPGAFGPGGALGIGTGGPDAAGAPRVYAVGSGKGGVGKSTVTANLAAALALDGLRVGVLDADVWGYSIPRAFGVNRAPVALAGLMFPVEAHGVRLMSVGFLVGEDEPVVWRGPMLHKAIAQFCSDVYWGGLDVLLVDLPPGTGDVTLSLMELLPSAALLAVTTPQPAARGVAVRVGRLAASSGMPVAGVVENMTDLACDGCGARTPMFGSGGGAALAEALDAPLLGAVPLDLPLRVGGDTGVPAVIGAPGAPSAAELRRIAAALPSVRRSLVGVPLPLSVT